MTLWKKTKIVSQILYLDGNEEACSTNGNPDSDDLIHVVLNITEKKIVGHYMLSKSYFLYIFATLFHCYHIISYKSFIAIITVHTSLNLSYVVFFMSS